MIKVRGALVKKHFTRIGFARLFAHRDPKQSYPCLQSTKCKSQRAIQNPYIYAGE